MHSGEIRVLPSIASWDHADIILEQRAGLKGVQRCMGLPGRQGAGGANFNIHPHTAASVVKDIAEVTYDSTYSWYYSQRGVKVERELGKVSGWGAR